MLLFTSYNILVTGPNDEHHWKSMCSVLGRLQEAGVCLKLAKCKFMKETVDYLGHVITNKGLQPSPKNIEVVLFGSETTRHQNAPKLHQPH